MKSLKCIIFNVDHGFCAFGLAPEIWSMFNESISQHISLS